VLRFIRHPVDFHYYGIADCTVGTVEILRGNTFCVSTGLVGSYAPVILGALWMVPIWCRGAWNAFGNLHF